MNHWVMDYETLKNCFTAVFEHYKTDETRVFVVHELQNDFKEFGQFLQENLDNKEWHISFNGIAFDAQITHFVIDHYDELVNKSGDEIARELYKCAQTTIQLSNNKEFSIYPEWSMRIGQIDLFKLNHWDNAAKRSSLKWIQYTMDWKNIVDMPIHHETEIKTQAEIDLILHYCKNDVKSTKEIYNRSIPLVSLRKTLTSEYNINLFSASEPRISKELFGFYLSKELNIPKQELKKLRTYRKNIIVKDLILDYINFESAEFKLLLEKFNTVEIDPNNTKGGFKYSVNYKGVKTDFGLGGVHGAAKSGVYESNADTVIMSSDVTSFYPNLAIKNKISPAHLPKEQFCNLYEWFFEERKKIPKKDPMNYVYKIILNSTYGLSNDQHSFLYDPQFTMFITINGQLSLMMLYEMIMEAIPEAVPLLQNTDGIETIIPKDKIDLYLELCKKWEDITALQLEHDQYQKIVLGDVNNYIALYDYKTVEPETWKKIKAENPHYLFRILDGNFQYAATKAKGRFEFSGLALHKNKSKLVISKGIYEYFIKGVFPEDYIKSNTDILDYCIGSKSNGEWEQVAHSIENGIPETKKLQKINRYYVSKSGCKILKVNKNDKREIQLEAGKWLQTIFNDQIEKEWSEYDIDFSYYLKAIEKEINNIIVPKTNQLTLF